MQAQGIEKGEFAKIILGDAAAFDQFVSLRDRLGHVGHVPVRDIRSHHRAQPRSQRVDVAGERPSHQRVIGLASEVEIRHESIPDILGLANHGAREFVEHPGARRRPGEELANAIGPGPHRVVAVLLDVLHQLVDIQTIRIEVKNRLGVALAPVTEKLRIQAAGPGHAALKEAEAQGRKTARHPAEEKRFGQRLMRSGERPDVVVHIVRHRARNSRVQVRAVRQRRHAQLHALRPERIIVVLAVEAESIEPETLRAVAPVSEHPPRITGDDHGLQPQLRDRILQLGDRGLRIVHGNDTADGDAILERLEDTGEPAVGAARQRRPSSTSSRSTNASTAEG